MERLPLDDDPGPYGRPAALEAPEASDEAVDADLVAARGGRHRLVGRGWLSYAMLLLAPLGLAMAITVLSSLPSRPNARPWANDAPGTAPLPLVPTPIPAPTSAQPSTQPSPSGTGRDKSAQPTSGASTTITLLGPNTAPSSAAPSSATGPTTLDSLTLEAEDAQLGKMLTSSQAADASGGFVVVGVGKNKHRAVTFTNINSPTARTPQLRLYYSASKAANLTVHTSAGGNAAVSCPETRSGEILAMTVTVQLNAGSNSITVEASGGSLELDRITLS